ncbi:PREDICTED: uncharacterized protein LOC104820872 [Tarenaya hassleriana]|uniref:uncharacterized protein LOC104820872 n=1 Tax=Tarenaya hassleriana TaxID=28532 RepID=UPI00053C4526|nr:PREDICTED: uncharacterized protein LOC104820872 [Tarenaya hassleriana]
MERKKLVICVVVALLGALSAAAGFGAEATRIKSSQVKYNSTDSASGCSYPRSPAFNLGFTSAVILMIAQIIINVAGGCICCRKGPAPSQSNWIIALVCFVVSWFTFVIAFLLLLTGAALNDETSQERISAGNSYCYIVKPGVFAGGSVLSLVSLGLGIVYYLTLNSAKHNASSPAAATAQTAGIAMGQPPVQRAGDPVFVHEDTYMRRQFT